MIKEINLPSGNYLFVEVPDDAYDFTWSTEQDLHTIVDGKDVDVFVGKNVKIISTTKDITEKQAESIVGRKFENGYYEFLKPGMMRVASMKHSYPFDTAKESLQSLLQANGLDTNKNYLILKRL